MIGETIAHYRILEKLGGGGMGVVYVAENLKLKSRVALKFLPPHLHGDEDSKQRFVREAQAASGLNHPNVCTIHDVDETQDGRLFIAMAHYEGETLKTRLERGPLKIDEAVSIAGQVADGLAAAHERDIIHRDVKPANIIITSKGRAVILDFGLAKLVGGADVTQSGVAIGTPAYMSPEQVLAEPVDHRADIWGLGAILYEMIAGRRAFEGEYAGAITFAIQNHDPTAVTDIREDVPPALGSLITRLLAKNPADRVQDMETVVRLLDACASVTVAATRVFDRRRAVLYLVTAAVVLIGAAVALIVRVSRVEQPIASAEGQRIAVLPFSIRGSSEYAYLGEGMVDLLSTKLDGARSWRRVDPRVILGMTGGDRTPQDPEAGRDLAERLNASRFVMGNVVQVGPNIRVDASLYETGGSSQAIANATTEGPTDELFDMLDDLAAQLLAGQIEGPGSRVMRLAAMTTHSIDAAKAYLEGERLLRSSRFGEAAEAFQKAVERDTMFALAWYRMSVTADWLTRQDLAAHASAQAVRFSDRLSERDRRLLEALDLQRRGEYTEAERVYGSILATYPDDVESWSQLGELQFHYGPTVGRPTHESTAAWHTVLRFETDNAQAMTHLARIEIKEGRYASGDSLIGRVLELSPGGDREAELMALRALIYGDEKMKQSVLRSLRQVSEAVLAEAVWGVTAFTDSALWAIELTRLMTESTRTDETRALGHVWRAYLLCSLGRFSQAADELRAVEVLRPAWAIEHGAAIATLPFAPADGDERRRRRDRLAAWNAASVPDTKTPVSWHSADNGLNEIIRLYLLGILSARLGDLADASKRAEALASHDVPAYAGTISTDMAASVEAEVRLARGDSSAALAQLEQIERRYPYQLVTASTFYGLPRSRLLLAELLDQAGRTQESLRWLRSFEETALFDVAYRAPAHMLRARILQRTGHHERAKQHYRMVITLWKDGDPVTQSVVDQASAALLDMSE